MYLFILQLNYYFFFFTGILLFLWTRHNFLHARCRPPADILAWHSLGYFLHDTRWLCHLRALRRRGGEYLSDGRSELKFERPSLLLHHLVVIGAYTPIVLRLRGAVGDCFVGATFAMELR